MSAGRKHTKAEAAALRVLFAQTVDITAVNAVHVSNKTIDDGRHRHIYWQTADRLVDQGLAVKIHPEWLGLTEEGWVAACELAGGAS